MGKTLLYGLVIGVPTVVIAGILLSRVLPAAQKKHFYYAKEDVSVNNQQLPPTLLSFAIALLPIFLITTAILAHQFLKKDAIAYNIANIIGEPVIALLIASLCALLFLGLLKNQTVLTLMQWLQLSMNGISMILLIITAGGVFKQVIVDSGAGDYIASFSKQWQLPPLLFAWLITALLRIAIGSATVAGITSAGIVLPLLASSGASPELMVLAVGAGTVFGSHINDTGFWMFKEFFQLSIQQTFLSWTVMESIISILGLIGVMVLEKLL